MEYNLQVPAIGELNDTELPLSLVLMAGWLLQYMLLA
jgi:hypothetical protein